MTIKSKYLLNQPKFVFLTAFVSFTLLIIIGFYAWYFKEKSYNDLISRIELSKGKHEIICLDYLTITAINGFYIISVNRRGKEFILYDQIFEFKTGHVYSVTGAFSQTGVLLVTSVTEYPYRPYKYAFSALSFLFILNITIKFLRIDLVNKKFYLKEY